MESETFNIAELAEAAGVSARAVRFYVQEGLLAPPEGGGRGSHYQRNHLERLRRIGELQRAGHSLMAIRQILEGKAVPPPSHPMPRPIVEQVMPARLMTRVELVEGVELSFDAGRFAPDPQKLLGLRELAREVFRR